MGWQSRQRSVRRLSKTSLESCKVRIEVVARESGRKGLLLILDRKVAGMVIEPVHAEAIAEMLEMVSRDAQDFSEPLDRLELQLDQDKIQLGTEKGLVRMVFDWADRIEYGWRSALVLAAALREMAIRAESAFK